MGALPGVYRGGWKRRVEGGCGAGTKPHHHRHQYAELERHRNDKATPREPRTQRVPIMAITAYGNGVAREALEAGANRSATKPIQFSALIVDIRELLAQSTTPRGDS